MSALRVPRALLDRMRAAAVRRFPEEACGMLVGRRGEVEVLVENDNAAAEPRRRYEIAPEDLFAIHKRCRAENREVLGYWHSHPTGTAEPSAEDGAGAFSGVSFVIVPVATVDAATPRAGSPRAWNWDGSRWHEVRLETGPSEIETRENG